MKEVKCPRCEYTYESGYLHICRSMPNKRSVVDVVEWIEQNIRPRVEPTPEVKHNATE